MKVKFLLLLALLAGRSAFAQLQLQPPGAAAATAATAGNQFGVDLHRLLAKEQPDKNGLISPWSIHGALAMTSAGAAGQTLAEMEQVLHSPARDALHPAYEELDQLVFQSVRGARKAATGSTDSQLQPPEIHLASRLFGQQGFDFQLSFLDVVRYHYQAQMRPMDFRQAPEAARREINDWVAGETQRKIGEIIPAGGITTNTHLVLANALYFKAPWAEHKGFKKEATVPGRFWVGGKAAQEVPTMTTQAEYGYAQLPGFKAVAIPFVGGDFQLVILLPDGVDGLPALEGKLNGKILQDCAAMGAAEVKLFLPKFRLAWEAKELSAALKSLGMIQAFDAKAGGADFARMALSFTIPPERISIGEVRHATVLNLDEEGTEAAAVTTVEIVELSVGIDTEPVKPVVVRVDHPFLFAIQHKPTGVCLFLGRVVDPR